MKETEKETYVIHAVPKDTNHGSKEPENAALFDPVVRGSLPAPPAIANRAIGSAPGQTGAPTPRPGGPQPSGFTTHCVRASENSFAPPGDVFQGALLLPPAVLRCGERPFFSPGLFATICNR